MPPRPVFALLFVVSAAPGCNPFRGDGAHTRVLATCPSPDGRLRATLTRTWGGGAAGWEYNEVRVHPPATVPDSARPVFAIADDRQLHVVWTSGRELVVEYPAASVVRRIEGEYRRWADTVRLVPRPVPGMQQDLSDMPSCRPYRPGGPLAPPPARDAV